MPTLTPAERRALRAKAHPLHPVVAIGQHGLTPGVMHEIDVALKAHELVKVRVFDDDRVAREGLLTRICAELGCAPVQHIGKLLVVWRENPEKVEQAAKPAATRPPRGSKASPAVRRPASAARGEASPRRRRAMAAEPRAPAMGARPPDARRRRGRSDADAPVPAGPHAPSRRRRRTAGS